MSGAGGDAVTAVHVVVVGHVQGVWFRRSLQEAAQARGVTGWVRNLGDGRVEAWLEGEAGSRDAVLSWVRAGGPSGARVDDVEVTDRAATGHRGFEVR